jgi:hypothetical protein
MPNVSLARPNSNLQKFPRAAKFPLAHNARNLPQYTHAAQAPPRPRGLPAGRQAPSGPPRALRAANSADSCCCPGLSQPKAADHTGDASKHQQLDWRHAMDILTFVVQFCSIVNCVLSVLNYLENRRKRKDDADEKKF